MKIPRSYGHAIVLALMFQVTAWALCFVGGSMYGPAEVSGGMLLNGRVWCTSCSLYWLGFLLIFLTRRESPQLWRLLYVGLGFPTLFIGAAALVPRFFGAD